MILFSWVAATFQLYLLIVVVAPSEVLLHRLDYEITKHNSKNEVGSINNVPSNNCGYGYRLNDPILELFRSPEVACINLERNFWKNVETYCPIVTEQYDHFKISHFQYPVNLRILAHNFEMVYITFDIIGDSPKLYGNWWRVYIVDKSYRVHNNGIGFDYDNEDNMLELTGRVIDHWNGTYSVLFAIPIVNLGTEITNDKKLTFTLDVTLDYLACAGFAENLFPWKNLHGKVSYLGDFAMGLKLDIYVNITASVPQCSVSNIDSTLLSTAQYLCDTGYYNSNVWIPSKSMHRCDKETTHSKLQTKSYLPNAQGTPILKNSIDFDTSKNNKLIFFVGDSTMGQIGKCFVFQKDPCGNEKQCNRANYSIQLCTGLAQLSRHKKTWHLLSKDQKFIALLGIEGVHNSSRFISQLKHSVKDKDINEYDEVVIVFNIGLHEMKNGVWTMQKLHLRALITTLTSNELRRSFQIPVRVIWRSTFSIHEYCYQRNNYWFRLNSILNTYTAAAAVTRLRDPTSWLHNSYVLDTLYNISNPGSLMYLDNYWLSKSRVKRYSAEQRQHDMRHHDTIVIRAAIETIIDSMF